MAAAARFPMAAAGRTALAIFGRSRAWSVYAAAVRSRYVDAAAGHLLVV